MTVHSKSDDSGRVSARRQRRRQRLQAPVDYLVPSPCVSVCAFNGDPFCRGCYRSADEIRNWIIMTREQKLDVLEHIRRRRQPSA